VCGLTLSVATRDFAALTDGGGIFNNPIVTETVELANGTPAPPEAQAPFRAVHTSKFPGLRRRMGASLLVTTY
jgi:hypothetical protein